MALTIENVEIESLADEVATLAHETKTEAIKQALVERRARLQPKAGIPEGRKNLREFMEKEIWPLMPASELGRVMTREEEDEILGYGPNGY